MVWGIEHNALKAVGSSKLASRVELIRRRDNWSSVFVNAIQAGELEELIELIEMGCSAEFEEGGGAEWREGDMGSRTPRESAVKLQGRDLFPKLFREVIYL